MHSGSNIIKVSFLFLAIFAGVSCEQRNMPPEAEIVETPDEMNARVSENLKTVLQYATQEGGAVSGNTVLHLPQILWRYYNQANFERLWSTHNTFLPEASELIRFINSARQYGLYPEDYHQEEINNIVQVLKTDSLLQKDAVSWTKSDLLFTDAFILLLKDLKEGRMIADSNSISRNTGKIDSFFLPEISLVAKKKPVQEILEAVQPLHQDYKDLIAALKTYVPNMDTVVYPKVDYPNPDSLDFVKKVYLRLVQFGYGADTITDPSLAQYTDALKKFQTKEGLVVDGKAGPAVVRKLDLSDRERFRHIAITLDRYKQMPLYPATYIQVNIPSQYLKVINDDTLVIESKVVVGKPSTRTPELTSSISNMVTYPQWTVPVSIIRQDILPELKKDPGYLARKNFSLVSEKGETINPYEVNWSKYTTWIPWRVVQGSGDDNALGVFKFNFNNPYSVYLHDTNQRYLFKNANRALSHGCVRVEKWHALAAFIAGRDSSLLQPGEHAGYTIDSINTWIDQKRRTTILVKKRVPLFINYFTCEAKNGEIVFYDDVYHEDEELAKKYFKNK